MPSLTRPGPPAERIAMPFVSRLMHLIYLFYSLHFKTSYRQQSYTMATQYDSLDISRLRDFALGLDEADDVSARNPSLHI